MKTMETTLLFILKDGKILLAEKKRGFGKGLMNGVGGKLEKGETVEEAMLRETKEEINVTPLEYRQVGKIYFDLYLNEEEGKEITYVYIANDYEGDVCETEEMKPKWYNLNDIPYEQMYEGDKIWLKKVLAGEFVTAHFTFDKNFHVVSYKFD